MSYHNQSKKGREMPARSHNQNSNNNNQNSYNRQQQSSGRSTQGQSYTNSQRQAAQPPSYYYRAPQPSSLSPPDLSSSVSSRSSTSRRGRGPQGGRQQDRQEGGQRTRRARELTPGPPAWCLKGKETTCVENYRLKRGQETSSRNQPVISTNQLARKLTSGCDSDYQSQKARAELVLSVSAALQDLDLPYVLKDVHTAVGVLQVKGRTKEKWTKDKLKDLAKLFEEYQKKARSAYHSYRPQERRVLKEAFENSMYSPRYSFRELWLWAMFASRRSWDEYVEDYAEDVINKRLDDWPEFSRVRR